MRRIVRGRRIEATPALFPGYLFISIEQRWHAARWSPGIAALVMSGEAPAHVLPPCFKLGDPVRIERGPLEGLAGLYAGQSGADRV